MCTHGGQNTMPGVPQVPPTPLRQLSHWLGTGQVCYAAGRQVNPRDLVSAFPVPGFKKNFFN